MGLLDALQDKGFRNDVADGLRNALNRGLLGGVLGAPVDLATMALRPLGYKVEQPVMGSDWIGQKLQDAGMVSSKRNQLAEMMAGLLDPATMATGAVKAAAAAPMVAGMFIGKGAKTWDALQASKALELEKAGTPARQIWSETGTWKGPDGMWRQEIPDNNALFNTSTVGGKKIENDITHGMGGVDLGPAANLMEHPQLRAAYDSSIAPSSYVENSRTMLQGDKGMFNGDSVTLYAPAKAKDAKSTLLHELQHAIQTKEGWATGGSSQMAYQDPQAFQILAKLRKEMSSPMPVEKYAKDAWGSATVTPEIAADYAKSYLPSIKKIPREIDVAAQETAAQEYYRRLAGEAEARATQARIPLDATQRRSTFPEDSYDVPINQLIVRGLLER